MIDEVIMKENEKLMELYEYRWGKRVDTLIMPKGISQESLNIVLKRIVDTGESIFVGYECIYRKENPNANKSTH